MRIVRRARPASFVLSRLGQGRALRRQSIVANTRHAAVVEFTVDAARVCIARLRWQFARTMPQWPHEYTAREESSELEPDFFAFAALNIRDRVRRLWWASGVPPTSATAAPEKRYVHSSAKGRDRAKATAPRGSALPAAEHVGQPGATPRLGAEEVRVVALDDNRRSPPRLGEPLQLEGQGASESEVARFSRVLRSTSPMTSPPTRAA